MANRLTAQEKAALVRRHLDDGVPLARLAEHAGIPVRTLCRWAASYRAEGNVAALQRKTRNDCSHRRVPADLVEAAEALALKRPAPTTAFVYRRVGDLARDRGFPRRATQRCGPSSTRSTPDCAPSPSTGTPPTGTGLSWSTAAPRPSRGGGDGGRLRRRLGWWQGPAVRSRGSESPSPASSIALQRRHQMQCRPDPPAIFQARVTHPGPVDRWHVSSRTLGPLGG